jgi:pimeloyl-ACP methyl ester carboxylesterase
VADPILEISVRSPLPEGVNVAAQVQIVSGSFNPAPSSLLIFIHGFNDTRAFAECAYKEFLANSDLANHPLIGSPCFFHWPGNRNWGVFSVAAYVVDPGTAEQSAALLYRFLASPQVSGLKPLQITLVTHSLGGRVALELLKLAAADAGNHFRPQVNVLCMMAAAVMVSAVEPAGYLGPAARLPNRTAALYSQYDDVLKFGFPVGETAAREGFFPTAVGHGGDPSMLWNARPDMGLYRYGHSSYWPGAESAAAVATFLNPPSPPPTPLRSTAIRTRPERSLPPPAALVSRTVG